MTTFFLCITSHVDVQFLPFEQNLRLLENLAFNALQDKIPEI